MATSVNKMATPSEQVTTPTDKKEIQTIGAEKGSDNVTCKVVAGDIQGMPDTKTPTQQGRDCNQGTGKPETNSKEPCKAAGTGNNEPGKDITCNKMTEACNKETPTKLANLQNICNCKEGTCNSEACKATTCDKLECKSGTCNCNEQGHARPHTTTLEPTGKEKCSMSKEKGDNTLSIQEQTKTSPLPQGADLKAVLFDIDGTIADSDPIHFLAFQEILSEAGYNGGVPITHEFFIREMSGKLNYVIAQELMPEMDKAKRIQYMDEKEVHYRKLAAKDLQPIPGFHLFVEWVKKHNLRRAAVTNSPRLNAEQVLTALKVTDFFELLVVGNECKRPKPFPDPYLQAIKFFGIDPKQCLVFEDSPSGVKAGVAAGAPTVGLLTGHPSEILTASGASLLIKDYNDPVLWEALGEPCHKSGSQSCSTPLEQPQAILVHDTPNILQAQKETGIHT